MFDQLAFDNMPKYDDFTYWFTRCSDRANIWTAIDKSTASAVTIVDECAEDSKMILDREQITGDECLTIIREFNLFRNRPEYLVGKHINVNTISSEEAANVYEKLLVGILFMRARKGSVNPDGAFARFQTCLDWLRTTDMYTAPASTQYHESFPSGLLFHTLKVYNRAVELSRLHMFQTVSLDSCVLVSLVHDWCKIGLYEQYMRNAKNDKTGKWEQVPSYRHKQTGIPLGHGASSMYIASKFFRLSQEEAVAIRWHMGAWRVVSSEMDELQLANENYPLVHLLQFADQLSIVNYINEP